MLDISVVSFSINKNLNFAKEISKRNCEQILFCKSIVLHQYVIITELEVYDVINGGKKEIQPIMKNFSERIYCAVSEIKTEHVLFLLDDFLILSMDHINEVDRVINILNPSYIRLNKNANYGAGLLDFNFKITSTQNIYRINTQPSIWKTEVLLDIANKCISSNILSSPWGIELYWGVRFSDELGLTLTANKDYIKSVELIKRGSLLPYLSKKHKIETIINMHSYTFELFIVVSGHFKRFFISTYLKYKNNFTI